MIFALRLTQTDRLTVSQSVRECHKMGQDFAFRIPKANELEIMRLKFKKRAIYVKNLSKHKYNWPEAGLKDF